MSRYICQQIRARRSPNLIIDNCKPVFFLRQTEYFLREICSTRRKNPTGPKDKMGAA